MSVYIRLVITCVSVIRIHQFTLWGCTYSLEQEMHLSSAWTTALFSLVSSVFMGCVLLPPQ